MRRRIAPWLAWALLSACGDDRPYFQSVLAPSDTWDTVGPYVVEAYVVAPRGLERVEARLRASGTVLAGVQVDAAEGERAPSLWRLELPGQSAGYRYEYELVAVDTTGSKARYPTDKEAFLSLAVVVR